MSRSTPTAGAYSRRSFIQFTGGSVLAGGLLAACGESALSGSSSAATNEIRASWFGGDDRHKRTVAAFGLIQSKVKGLTVTTEYGGFDGYFDKLSTQIAGGNAPALVQMNFDPQLSEFAGRGALTDLSGYRGKGLDLAALPDAGIESAELDGKLFGVSLGTLVPAVMVDATLLEQYGLSAPKTWDWDMYGAFATEVATASGGKIAGSEDASGYDNALQVWLMQRGRGGIFDAEGKVSATEADLKDWFDFWAGLRAVGAIVPIDVQAAHSNGDHPTNPVVLGKAALGLQFSTTHAVWSGITKDALTFAQFPNGPAGSGPGNYARPSALWSVPKGTKDVESAVQVIDLFINDPDVSKALGFCRAMPNANAIKAIGSNVQAGEKALIDHTAAVLGGKLAPAPRTPKKASESAALLKRTAEELAFGRTSSADAAKAFVDGIKAMVSA